MKEKTKYQGALPAQHLKSFFANEFIKGNEGNVKPSSLDLTITDEIYEVPGSFQVPRDATVLSVIKELGGKKVSLDKPLEVGNYYIAKIAEKIDLPKGIYGYANPKSTTGRLDMHARLLADRVPQNDAISEAFDGELWVQIKPQSFSIKLHPGVALNQVRLFYSDTRLNRIELEQLMKKTGLLFCEELQNKDNEHGLVRYKDMQVQDSPDSIVLRLDGKVGANNEPIGYRAKETKEVIDYLQSYKAEDFFEVIGLEKNGLLFLPKDCFSILSSIEHVSVPGNLACEMAPIDDRFGELRAHYAGFIDPGWGWKADGSVFGKPLTLEVRSFENIYVRDGQPIARIKYERLAEMPNVVYDSMNSNYLVQNKAKLAKQFN
jgi:dCTP deaminase